MYPRTNCAAHIGVILTPRENVCVTVYAIKFSRQLFHTKPPNRRVIRSDRPTSSDIQAGRSLLSPVIMPERAK
jgi:hypothetical protein